MTSLHTDAPFTVPPICLPTPPEDPQAWPSACEPKQGEPGAEPGEAHGYPPPAFTHAAGAGPLARVDKLFDAHEFVARLETLAHASRYGDVRSELAALDDAALGALVTGRPIPMAVAGWPSVVMSKALTESDLNGLCETIDWAMHRGAIDKPLAQRVHAAYASMTPTHETLNKPRELLEALLKLRQPTRLDEVAKRLDKLDGPSLARLLSESLQSSDFRAMDLLYDVTNRPAAGPHLNRRLQIARASEFESYAPPANAHDLRRRMSGPHAVRKEIMNLNQADLEALLSGKEIPAAHSEAFPEAGLSHAALDGLAEQLIGALGTAGIYSDLQFRVAQAVAAHAEKFNPQALKEFLSLWRVKLGGVEFEQVNAVIEANPEPAVRFALMEARGVERVRQPNVMLAVGLASKSRKISDGLESLESKGGVIGWLQSEPPVKFARALADRKNINIYGPYRGRLELAYVLGHELHHIQDSKIDKLRKCDVDSAEEGVALLIEIEGSADFAGIEAHREVQAAPGERFTEQEISLAQRPFVEEAHARYLAALARGDAKPKARETAEHEMGEAYYLHKQSQDPEDPSLSAVSDFLERCPSFKPRP